MPSIPSPTPASQPMPSLPAPLPPERVAALGLAVHGLQLAADADPAVGTYPLITCTNPVGGGILAGTLGIAADPSAAPQLAVMVWLGPIYKGEVLALTERIATQAGLPTHLWQGERTPAGTPAWIYSLLAPDAALDQVSDALADLHGMLDSVLGDPAEHATPARRQWAHMRRQGMCLRREVYAPAPGAMMQVPLGLRAADDATTPRGPHAADDAAKGPGGPATVEEVDEEAMRELRELLGTASAPAEPPAASTAHVLDPRRWRVGSLEWLRAVSAEIGEWDPRDQTVKLPYGVGDTDWYTAALPGVDNAWARAIPEGTFGTGEQGGYSAYVVPAKGRSRTLRIYSTEGPADIRAVPALKTLCDRAAGFKVRLLTLRPEEIPLYQQARLLRPLRIDPNA